VFHAQTKHIEAQYQLVREKLEDGTFKIGHVQSRLQLVDMLTKPQLGKIVHKRLRDNIGIISACSLLQTIDY
jgi:hypothetical protein